MGFEETFKALSDPVRREILVLLKDGKLSAGEIAGCFEMTQATVSYHLSKLKQADLIFENKYKNYKYYYNSCFTFKSSWNFFIFRISKQNTIEPTSMSVDIFKLSYSLQS